MGAETAYPSGAPEFNPIISGIRVSFMINALYIAVYPVVLFMFAIVLSVILRFTDSAYPFGISKLYLRFDLIFGV